MVDSFRVLLTDASFLVFSGKIYHIVVCCPILCAKFFMHLTCLSLESCDLWVFSRFQIRTMLYVS